jgi:hypothetical protein
VIDFASMTERRGSFLRVVTEAELAAFSGVCDLLFSLYKSQVLDALGFSQYAQLLSHMGIRDEHALEKLVQRYQSDLQTGDLAAVVPLCILDDMNSLSFRRFISDVRARVHVLILQGTHADESLSDRSLQDSIRLRVLYEDKDLFGETVRVTCRRIDSAQSLVKFMQHTSIAASVLHCSKLIIHFCGVNVEPAEMVQLVTTVLAPEKTLFFDMCESAPVVDAFSRVDAQCRSLAVFGASTSQQSAPLKDGFTSLLLAAFRKSGDRPAAEEGAKSKCVVATNACHRFHDAVTQSQRMTFENLLGYLCDHIEALGGVLNYCLRGEPFTVLSFQQEEIRAGRQLDAQIASLIDPYLAIKRVVYKRISELKVMTFQIDTGSASFLMDLGDRFMFPSLRPFPSSKKSEAVEEILRTCSSERILLPSASSWRICGPAKRGGCRASHLCSLFFLIVTRCDCRVRMSGSIWDRCSALTQRICSRR